MSGALDEFTPASQDVGLGIPELNSNLSTTSGIGTSAPTPNMTNNLTDGTSPGSILDGTLQSALQQTGTLYNGKTLFDNSQTGYILGFNSILGFAQFYIGNTTNYINWTGTQFQVTGVLLGIPVAPNYRFYIDGNSGIYDSQGRGTKIQIDGGNGAPSGTSPTGGDVSLHAGNATASNGGSILLVAGVSSLAGSFGGGVQIRTQDSTTDSGGAGNNSTPGDIQFLLGKSPDGVHGYVSFQIGTISYGSPGSGQHQFFRFDFGSIPGGSVLTATWPAVTGTVTIATSGNGAPGSTPVAVGLIYCDTTGNKAYISCGTSSSADWRILN